jgi:hypothetical protein
MLCAIGALALFAAAMGGPLHAASTSGDLTQVTGRPDLLVNNLYQVVYPIHFTYLGWQYDGYTTELRLSVVNRGSGTSKACTTRVQYGRTLSDWEFGTGVIRDLETPSLVPGQYFEPILDKTTVAYVRYSSYHASPSLYFYAIADLDWGNAVAELREDNNHLSVSPVYTAYLR